MIRIEEIKDLEVEQDEDKLKVRFILVTDQGDTEVETDV